MKEYYRYYLSLHQNHLCRRMHFLGQLTTLMFIVSVVSSGKLILLFFAPFIVYPFAWTGHHFFEKNKPLAWEGKKDFGLTTLKAKVCDWIMFKDITFTC